jgi:hypothetical protein
MVMHSTENDRSRSPGFAARASNLVLRFVSIVALIASMAVLGLTLHLLAREATWLPSPAPPRRGETEEERNERAFFRGTIGTEVVPLPVLKVLPEICPDHFYPWQKDAGSWVEQFGFLPASLVPPSVGVEPLAKDLPLGFTLSHYRPKSGAPSPVLFVGLACATCHTAQINGKLVVGVGNTSLNLFAWIDAFQAALRDDRVSYDSVVRAYEDNPDNPRLSLEEKGIIWMWLKGARDKQAEDATKYDEPFGRGLSMRPENVPTGPCRTQPFRTLVRTLEHRPGTDMKVYTKIAALTGVYWEEKVGGWGQFDGSIHGLHRRSAAAALAAGATPQNMNLREIANNIIWATDYVNRADFPRPAWNDVFPKHALAAKSEIDRGKAVYLNHCNRCHGHPEGNRWCPGEMEGQLTLLSNIQTDPERVTFRYFEDIPNKLSDYFPQGHPFDFPRNELRPKQRQDPQEEVVRGYINKPMPSMFSRAPYLHNASVMTLAELIHLVPRKVVFFRGANEYDPELVGLKAPEKDPANRRLYFQFDTAAPGNSNKGHDYPWTREEVVKDQKKQRDLKALLEYLKTL